MGASVSKNVTNVVVNAVAKISSEIVQKTKLSYDSSQVISIKNTKGDVVIRGNKFYQRAYLNMTALFNAMSTESAQQNLALELAQEAKSVTSGINIGQFSDATNIINSVVNVTVELTSKIGQECAAMAQQSQVINIVGTVGNVTIENNVFDQMANVMSTCTENAVNNSQSVQDIVEKIKQSASAASQGISEWAIVAIVAALIGIPVVGGIAGGVAILKYLFPVMIIIGIILIVVYYVWSSTEIQMKAFSSFIKNTPVCLPQNPSAIMTSFPSAAAAGDACMKSKTCNAFDWQGININQDGSYKILTPAQTIFYDGVSSDCMNGIQPDHVNNVRPAVVFQGKGPPINIAAAVQGDAYVDTTTSNWYQIDTTWYKKDAIISTSFTSLTVVSKDPNPTDPGSTGAFIISISPDAPEYFKTFSYKNSAWAFVDQVSGPGMVPSAPSIINGSGFKTTLRRSWLLYVGIATSAIGIAGTIYTTTKQKENMTKTK